MGIANGIADAMQDARASQAESSARHASREALSASVEARRASEKAARSAEESLDYLQRLVKERQIRDSLAFILRGVINTLEEMQPDVRERLRDRIIQNARLNLDQKSKEKGVDYYAAAKESPTAVAIGVV
jgi:uncharacterized protein YeeX (DUF496 family)